MDNYFDRPDGETFVDQPTKPIPHADTWDTMSANQLLEVQVQLQTRLWEFRSNPAILTPLNAAVTRLAGLISRKLTENN